METKLNPFFKYKLLSCGAFTATQSLKTPRLWKIILGSKGYRNFRKYFIPHKLIGSGGRLVCTAGPSEEGLKELMDFKKTFEN